MSSITGETPITTVTGELSYLDPASTVLRRFTAPGASVNTGNYLPYEMPISNGRPVSGQFTLDRNGFVLAGHRSAIKAFTDREEVNRVYPGEVADFVRPATGADRVATLGWILFFTLNDSDHSRAWRVPHSAFLDRTARAAQPRHSIEFRSIAYFE